MKDQSNSFFSLAFQSLVVRSAIKIALIVGTILVLINHAPAILAWDVDLPRLLQIFLTYLVPYCVSTYSAVKAMQRHVP